MQRGAQVTLTPMASGGYGAWLGDHGGAPGVGRRLAAEAVDGALLLGAQVGLDRHGPQSSFGLSVGLLVVCRWSVESMTLSPVCLSFGHPELPCYY